ncbi:MAG: nuclear transport factor 2 family protein [Cyclobacteriaceae bacterium]
MKYIMLIPILTFVCCQTKNSLEQDKQEIEEMRRLLTEESIKGNADGFFEFVTNNIIFIRPNEKDLDTKEDMRKYILSLKENLLSINVERHPINEIEVFGNLAYVRYINSYDITMRADSSLYKISRKFLDIWEKDQGKWKMHRHMWGDLPQTINKE